MIAVKCWPTAVARPVTESCYQTMPPPAGCCHRTISPLADCHYQLPGCGFPAKPPLADFSYETISQQSDGRHQSISQIAGRRYGIISPPADCCPPPAGCQNPATPPGERCHYQIIPLPATCCHQATGSLAQSLTRSLLPPNHIPTSRLHLFMG